jgi:hypothetical protein
MCRSAERPVASATGEGQFAIAILKGDVMVIAVDLHHRSRRLRQPIQGAVRSKAVRSAPSLAVPTTHQVCTVDVALSFATGNSGDAIDSSGGDVTVKWFSQFQLRASPATTTIQAHYNGQRRLGQLTSFIASAQHAL